LRAAAVPVGYRTDVSALLAGLSMAVV